MKKLAIGLLCTVISPVFYANAVDDLQAKLNALHSMHADFTQVVKAGKREVSQSSGSMALSRPGKFRWQTKEPMAQLVVADGKKIWIYDNDLEQVTVKKQSQGVGGTAALFLSGYDDTVSRNFTAEEKNDTAARTTFNLVSKSSKENFQKVSLVFEGPILRTMIMHDQLGQTTVVELSAVTVNHRLADKLFSFTPPKGVDVVDQ